ncbi:MAG: DUF739 family protein [Saccharofermentanales bacterium]
MSKKYDYSKLRGLIKEFCGTQKNYANALGISLTTLNTRLNNETPFTQDEIRKSRDIFNIDDAELSDAVFFTYE